MLILSNILFNILIFLFARGFLIFFNLILKNKFEIDKEVVFGIKIYNFYSVLGLFIIGNYVFLVNFIYSVNQKFFKIILIFIILNLLNPPRIKNFNLLILKFLFVPLIISIGIYDLSFHYDAGLYHLNYQAIINDYKIIFGLTNLYDHYGFSSIIDYLSSFFLIGDNYILQNSLQVTFFISFFNLIIEIIFFSNSKFSKNVVFYLSIYLILDNFGISGGLNGSPQIQQITKFDSVFTIVYFFAVLFIFTSILQNSISNSEIRLILIFILFSIQIKLFGLSLLILLPHFINRLNLLKNLKRIFRVNSLIFFLFILWVIKNIIISGCLFFPVTFLCFDFLPWTDKVSTYNLSYILKEHIENSEFELLNNKTIFYNFLISLFLIIVIMFLKDNFRFFNPKISIWIFVYLIFNIFIYFNYSPILRYHSGFLISVLVIIVYQNNIGNNEIIKPRYTFLLILISLILVPRVDQYKNLSFEQLNNLILRPNEVEYVNYVGVKFVSPSIGDQCWVNIKCTPRTNFPPQSKKFNSIIFYKKLQSDT